MLFSGRGNDTLNSDSTVSSTVGCHYQIYVRIRLAAVLAPSFGLAWPTNLIQAFFTRATLISQHPDPTSRAGLACSSSPDGCFVRGRTSSPLCRGKKRRESVDLTILVDKIRACLIVIISLRPPTRAWESTANYGGGVAPLSSSTHHSRNRN